ncbi:uncharacterized protein BDZ83DRAFT_649481 [Colletotrichum acutatum]|uniref:Uncharacterized protein n=1 Tax=Glomerella acutata TaxID=27357 RepID=A0AAD8UTU7_GLOAC|nr:uncharacterized protein BDZ83DRAFT_649481 [Colletotrichum acutatum]KAK1727624.1 hypothetical protein BDZ83DRAFT_649481 [Colletotrichum acutatum]
MIGGAAFSAVGPLVLGHQRDSYSFAASRKTPRMRDAKVGWAKAVTPLAAVGGEVGRQMSACARDDVMKCTADGLCVFTGLAEDWEDMFMGLGDRVQSECK